MKLTISERVSLLNVIPSQGSVIALRILQDLREQLSFTEEELVEYKIKQERTPEGGMFVTWDEEVAKITKEIKIGKVAHGIIVDELKKLDRNQRLHVVQLPLYEKFVDGKEEDGSEKAKKKTKEQS